MPAVLLTAGATRNPIDAMRSISANSSGATGLWLAEALAPFGPVHLLGSEEALLRAALARRGAPCPAGRSEEAFGSTRDLMARMERWCRAHAEGVVIAAAAVGDYERVAPAEGPQKIPSGQAELVLRLGPTPKIIDQLHGWSPGLRLVSFKAASPETTPEQLAEIADKQRVRTRSSLVFANVLGRLGALALLVDARGVERFDDRGAALAALVARIEAGLPPAT